VVDAELHHSAGLDRAERLGSAVLNIVLDELFTPPNGLVGLVGAAEVVGVSKQRVYQLIDAGRFLAPLALVDGRRPVWLRSDVERFRDQRDEHR